MEAKKSVDRLCVLVDKHYQAISARLRAMAMSDSEKPIPDLRDQAVDVRDLAVILRVMEDAEDDPADASMPADGISAMDFNQELSKSRVYRKGSASQTSMVHSDGHTARWSHLSASSLAEVSNISVLDLAVTTNDVHNSKRDSQTWSNDNAIPRWPIQPTMNIAEPEEKTGSRSITTGLASYSTFDSDPCLSIPLTKDQLIRSLGPEVVAIARSLNEKSSMSNVISSQDDSSSSPRRLYEDDREYPCKACGEILEEGPAFELGRCCPILYYCQ